MPCMPLLRIQLIRRAEKASRRIQEFIRFDENCNLDTTLIGIFGFNIEIATFFERNFGVQGQIFLIFEPRWLEVAMIGRRRLIARTVGSACAILLVLEKSAAETLEAKRLILRGIHSGSKESVTHSLALEHFDRLPQSQIRTATPWTHGPIVFSGVLIRDLLNHYRVAGTLIAATALNQYTVQMPVAEVVRDGALVATRADGKEMPVRSKGPFWIVFNFDAGARLRKELTLSRSIWQLAKIEVL